MRRLCAIPVVALACGTPDPDPPASTDDLPAACPTPSAAPRGARHLTAWQYARIAEELLGETSDGLTDAFPPGSGAWDGLAEAQSVSAAHLTAWADAARVVASRLVARTPPARLEVEDLALPLGAPTTLASEPDGAWWALDGNAPGELVVPVPLHVDAPGTWLVSARGVWLTGFEVGLAPLGLRWRVGDDVSEPRSLTGTFDAPQVLTWELELRPQDEVALLIPTNGQYYAFALDWLLLEGPADARRGASDARQRWVPCDEIRDGKRPCAREALTGFTRHLWRRPATSEELGELLALFDQGVTDLVDFDAALALALEAVLRSPSFLVHLDDVADLAPGTAREATPHELASRLALLLWGGLPDDELAACADAGTLTPDPTATGPCALRTQVDRLLAHPAADAVVEDFTRQWLALDALDGLPRAAPYPPITPALADAMRTETLALVGAAWADEHPPRWLLEAASSPAPGLEAIYAGDTAPRAGLLGHASVLTLTSQPDRTSPVVRGQFVLDRLLCAPVDPPPPQIPALDAEAAASGDVRALLEAHRANPTCAGCHDALDPMGLPLETYDAVGRERATYADGSPVDPTIDLPDGTPLDGPAALSAHLAADPAVDACVVQHLATWALARPADSLDACELDRARAGPVHLRRALRALATSTTVTHVVAPEDR